MRTRSLAVFSMLFSLMSAGNAHGQWMPVIAKSAELTYQTSPDGTEVLTQEFRGEYFRSKDGSEVRTKQQAGATQGMKYLRDARSGNDYVIDLEKRIATVIFKHSLPLLPRKDRNTEDHQGLRTINELECLGLRIKLNGTYIPGVVWTSIENDLPIKQEVLLPETREVRSLYEIRLVEPDPSVFLIPIDFSVRTELVRYPSAP